MDVRVELPDVRETSIDPFDVAVGVRLRSLRHRRGLSLQSLGNGVGITYQQVQKYESGRNRLSIRTAVRLSELLECSLMDLIPPSENSPSPASGDLRNLVTPELAQTSMQMASLPSSKRKLVIELIQTLSAAGKSAS